MDLNGGFRKTRLNKHTLNLLSMIALKQYEAIFRRPAARTVGLEFGAQIIEVNAL